MQKQNHLKAEIEQWEYLSHWVEIDELARECTPRRPLKKLKIFKQESFGKRHEVLYNRLYLQKMILIGVAASLKYKLLVSRNLYERNGLVYGIYRIQIPGQQCRKVSGVEMVEEVGPEMEFNEEYKWFQSPIDDMKKLITKNDFYNRDEYIHWIKGIMKFTDDSAGNFTPYQFLRELDRLPLNEHYVFKVKLRNAMLTPIFLTSSDSKQLYKKWILAQKQLIEEIFDQPDSLAIKFKELQRIKQQIFKTLFENEKIGEAEEGPPFFRDLDSKSKSKDNLLKTQRKFAIILSQYRGITTTKQSLPESMEEKDVNSWTKIEIKARNGSIEPISGNLIFVKLCWSVSCEDRQTKLLLQCCNNRKVQEMYYEDVYSFWEKLEANEKFRQLIGVDKFMISLNDDEDNLEVVISNYVPACLLTNSLKEIDKIVILTLVLDQVIEICEKKGSEKEDLKNLSIEPYMIDHAIMRFEKAIKEVEQQADSLYKDIQPKLHYFY